MFRDDSKFAKHFVLGNKIEFGENRTMARRKGGRRKRYDHLSHTHTKHQCNPGTDSLKNIPSAVFQVVNQEVTRLTRTKKTNDATVIGVDRARGSERKEDGSIKPTTRGRRCRCSVFEAKFTINRRQLWGR